MTVLPFPDSIPARVIDEDLKRSPAQFIFAVRPRAGHDLVINLAPRRGFVLGSVDFGRSVLDIADQKTTYYTSGFEGLIERINAFVVRNDFRRVTAIGSSKSGFGALAVARKLAVLNPNRSFSAISFSGQTCLWPENPEISYPTYRALIKRATERRSIRTDLARFGAIPKISDIDNLTMLLVYGSRNRQDPQQAHALSGSSVLHYGLNTALHPTMVPFLMRTYSREEVGNVAGLVVLKAKTDADLTHSLKEANADGDTAQSVDPFADAIMAIGPQPYLARLIERLMDDPADVARQVGVGALSV